MLSHEDPLRVLLLEGSPRFDYRHPRGALLKDPGVKLRSFLSSADDDWEQPASEGETPLTRGTVQDALKGTDVLIWGDPRLERVAAGLEAFVRGGGGVLFVAGPSYADWRSPLFPVEPAVAAPAAAPDVAALVKRLDGEEIEARMEAAARLKELGPAAIPALRASMPGAGGELRDRLRGVLEELQARAADQALPIRPTARAPEALRLPELWARSPRLRWWLRVVPPEDAETWVETAEDDPVLSVRRLGRGRVALLATDEWWLWRRERGDQDYYKGTYRVVLRWLAGR